MMSDCPLAIRHKKGEYIWIGDFVDRGRFLLFWSFRAFRLYLGASSCIYIFWLMMYFVLFELSMIRGDTTMYLYLFLCFTFCYIFFLIYIYEVIHDICLVVYVYVKSKIYFVSFVFSTHAFMCLLSVTGIYKLILSYCCLHLQLIDSS